MKKFICGVLTGTMLMATVPTLAESTQSINAIFGRVKVVVNDKPVEQETLLYNGTTYVPLRAISEILAKDVNYDNITRTAYIDEAGSNRSDLINAEHETLKKEYSDAINLTVALGTKCNSHYDVVAVKNYSTAKNDYNSVIKSSDEIINNYSSSSQQLENDMKDCAKLLKNSAIQGNILVDLIQANKFDEASLVMDKHFAYLHDAIDIMDKIVDDSNILYTK